MMKSQPGSCVLLCVVVQIPRTGWEWFLNASEINTSNGIETLSYLFCRQADALIYTDELTVCAVSIIAALVADLL
jgi:hypothetical protein